MRPKKPNKFSLFVQNNLGTILFVLVVLIAMLFRFWHLSSLPPGLHPDEAANGLDIFRMFDHHDFRVIYNTNGPREALFFYLQALWVGLIGNSILALRIAPAIFGVLAVIMVYLLVKDWFDRRAALAASLCMAVNPWVVIISRDGFRASLVPFFVATVGFLAGRAYKTGKTWYFVLAGAVFGLGFYTYTSYGGLMVAALLMLIYLLIWRRAWLRKNLQNLGLSLAVVAIVLLPLITTVVLHPSDSIARAGGTSILNSQLNQGKPAQALLSSTAKTLLQYNFFGDENSRHNVPAQPLLNTFVGLMFVVGFVLALARFRRAPYAATVVLLASMMLPAIVTAEGIPHGLRSIGTSVAVFALVGVGVDYLLSRWYKIFPVNSPARVVGLSLVIALLGLTMLQGWKAYFVAWAQDPQTYQAYDEDMVAISKYLNSSNSQAKRYLVAGDYNAKPVEYLTHYKSSYNLVDSTQVLDLPLGGKKLIIVPASAQAKDLLELLRTKFQGGEFQTVLSEFSAKPLFYVYQN